MRVLVFVLPLFLFLTAGCDLVCIDDTGVVTACDSGNRCAFWYCSGGGSVCCPETHPYGCAEGLCAESTEACPVSLCDSEPLCGGTVCDATFPVVCRVERVGGTVWTCAADVATCEGVPGEVCVP